MLCLQDHQICHSLEPVCIKLYVIISHATQPFCWETPWCWQALGQSDSTVVAPVQLFHDEAQVWLQEWSSRKSPEQRWGVHQHRHQQEDVGKELDRTETEHDIRDRTFGIYNNLTAHSEPNNKENNTVLCVCDNEKHRAVSSHVWTEQGVVY